MRDPEQRSAFRGQGLAQHVARGLLGQWVEPRCGLVCKKKGRPGTQGSNHGHPLQFTTGHLRGGPLQRTFLHPTVVQPLNHLSPGGAMPTRHLLQVLFQALPRCKRLHRILIQLLKRGGRQTHSAQHVPSAWRQQAQQRVAQGAFATATRPLDHVVVPRPPVQVQSLPQDPGSTTHQEVLRAQHGGRPVAFIGRCSGLWAWPA